MWLLFVTGLLSILTQVVLLRELNAAFYGIELIYLLALAAWLLWTAAGATLTIRPPRARSATAIGVACAALAPLLLADVAFLRAVGLLFRGVSGAFLPFWQQLLALTIALAPVGVLLGLLFQWSARRFVGTRRTLAQAYAMESAGAFLGGLLATVLFRAGLQTFTLAAFCAILALAVPLAQTARETRRRARAAAVALAVCAVGLFWSAGSIDRRMTTWQHPDLLDVRDSPYARVTMTQRAGQMAIFENNALAFETESTEAETFAHLVALQHPSPSRVLLLGGEPEGLMDHLLAHRLSRLDDVELDVVVSEMVARYVPAGSPQPGAETKILVSDPRRFLQTSERYDVILVGMPQPDSGAANRFYTREFFALCAARLAPAGIVGLRLRTAENLWTPAQKARMTSVYRALRSVFADVVVLPGSTNIVVASLAPLTRDSAVLAERLTARGIRARIVTPPYLRYLYTNDRRVEIAQLLESTPADANTDVRPVCYQYAAIIWLGKFWPPLARLDVAALTSQTASGRLARWILGGLVLVWFLGARRHAERRRRLLVLVAGFGGMVLETVLLLHYQLKQGALFEDLGALLASFMGGLVAGAIAARRIGVVRETIGGRWDVARWWGAALVVSLTLLGAAVAALVTAGWAASLLSIASLLALAGFLVAALFAYASLHHVTDQQAVISPLYAADLVGGSVGSLVATLVLIPLAGLASTALWMSLLAALSLLLL